MAGITQLKKEIQFNGRLGGLLNILKSIAAQQYQALEETLKVNPALFEALQAIAGTFSLERFPHPFTKGGGPVGVIAVTSDSGLLGGLNQQVITAALREYRKEPGELIVVGTRGVSYVREHRYACREFPGIQEETRRPLAEQVRDYALDRALQHRLGSLFIAYPRSLSFAVQRVEVIQALPCQSWLTGADPAARTIRGGAVLMESSLERVLEYVVWVWLDEKLYEVFGSSRLSEFGARSAHLEGSTQELQRRRTRLMRRYFRERREIIDRGMRELFAARSLFSGSGGS
jgi:F0F1-type ATP synthase gamma subunit